MKQINMTTTHQTLREELKNIWMEVSLMEFYDTETGIIHTDKIADWWLAKIDIQQKDFEARLEELRKEYLTN